MIGLNAAYTELYRKVKIHNRIFTSWNAICAIGMLFPSHDGVAIFAAFAFLSGAITYVSLIGAMHYEFVLDVLQHHKNEIKIVHSLILKLTEEK
jgi:hypothetical protein